MRPPPRRQTRKAAASEQWAAGGVILIGLVLAGLFGPSCNSAVTTDVLSEALKPGTIIFTAGALVAVVASLVVWQCAKQPGLLRTLVLLLGSALCAGAHEGRLAHDLQQRVT